MASATNRRHAPFQDFTSTRIYTISRFLRTLMLHIFKILFSPYTNSSIIHANHHHETATCANAAANIPAMQPANTRIGISASVTSRRSGAATNPAPTTKYDSHFLKLTTASSFAASSSETDAPSTATFGLPMPSHEPISTRTFSFSSVAADAPATIRTAKLHTNVFTTTTAFSLEMRGGPRRACRSTGGSGPPRPRGLRTTDASTSPS